MHIPEPPTDCGQELHARTKRQSGTTCRLLISHDLSCRRLDVHSALVLRTTNGLDLQVWTALDAPCPQSDDHAAGAQLAPETREFVASRFKVKQDMTCPCSSRIQDGVELDGDLQSWERTRRNRDDAALLAQCATETNSCTT